MRSRCHFYTLYVVPKLEPEQVASVLAYESECKFNSVSSSSWGEYWEKEEKCDDEKVYVYLHERVFEGRTVFKAPEQPHFPTLVSVYDTPRHDFWKNLILQHLKGKIVEEDPIQPSPEQLYRSLRDE